MVVDNKAFTIKYVIYFEHKNSKELSGIVDNPIVYFPNILEAHEVADKYNIMNLARSGKYVVKTVKLTVEILD
jgi:hypothetical protein